MFGHFSLDSTIVNGLNKFPSGGLIANEVNQSREIATAHFVPRNDYFNKSLTTNKAEPVNEKGTFVSKKVLPEDWGDPPLKLPLPKHLKWVYITNRISQLVTPIPRMVNFFNYYIAAVQYC